MTDLTQNAYQLKPPEELSAPGNGEWILIPIRNNGSREAAVTLSGTASWSGKVQGTNSTREDVIAGNAVAVDWPNGEISSVTNRVLFNFTAVRQVNVSGTTKLEVNA